jgi:hypothetical protein
MKRGRRTKTSPQVAHELWEQLTEKPSRHESNYVSWHLKHFVEPWLFMIIFAICGVGMFIMGVALALSLFVPATSGSITQDILITTQRVITGIYFGIGALLLPVSIREHFETKPKTKANKILAISAQIILNLALFIGGLILFDIVHLDSESRTTILLALFTAISPVYIAHTISARKITRQNIGVFLLVVTASVTSLLALIHLWR